METIEWFKISTGQFGYPQPEENFGYLNMTYDTTNACPTCHMGIRQISEFRFKSEPKAKHSDFIGLNWVFDQIFVREHVREILEKENVTGISFSTPLQNKTSKPLVTIQQLHVDTLITAGLVTENLKIEVCEYPKEASSIKFLEAMGGHLLKGPFCGQIKYNYPPYNSFSFRNGSFINMPDFVRLKTWFGSGASSSQPIFVSKKVKDIVAKHKWRGIFMNSVKFV